MDEVLKRRIAGALVLLALSFILVSLLPAPGLPTPEDGLQIVTVDLDGKAVARPAVPDAPALVAPGSAGLAPEASPPAAASIPAPPPAAAGAAAAIAVTEDEGLGAEVADPAQSARAAPAAEAAARPQATSEPAPSPAAPAAKAPPPAAQKPVVPVKPAVAPEAAATTRPVPPSAVRPAPVAAGGDAVAAGAWYVQVGGFADIANAHHTQAQLKAQGYGAIISPAETARGTLYRVRAGPFAARDAAQSAQQRLSTAYPGCAIVGP